MISAILATTVLSPAPIIEEKIAYEVDGVKCEGFFARPATKNQVPGVVIVHDWDGMNDYEMKRARQVASELGYAAFALDIYGVENKPKTMADNGRLAGKFYADRELFRKRLQGGASVLAERSLTGQYAVIGYCFGGAGALELARSGYPLKGAASFHGGLTTSMPATEGSIKAPVVVFHAAQDPVVPRADLNTFIDEMKTSKTDYQLIVYNVNGHAFTKSDGSDYNELADKRSWKTLTAFLKDAFGKG